VTTTAEKGAQALAELHVALRRKPDDVGALFDLACALRDMDDLAAARGFAARANELARTDSRPVRLLADVLLAQGFAAEAVAALVARHADFAGEPGYLLALAQAQRAQGDDAGERASLHAVLRSPHDHGAGHHQLATNWQRCGEPALARAHLEAAALAEASADASGATVHLTAAYSQRLVQAPHDRDALALVATSLLARGDLVAAGRACVRLLELHGDAGRALLSAASERWRTPANEEGPAAAAALVRRGLLLHVLGRRDQAKTCYERALTSIPEAPFARDLLAAINTALGLPDGHVAFALDALENQACNARELEQRAVVLASTPTTLEIASTNVCNIDPPCVQCWKHLDPAHGWLNDDARHLSRDQIETLAPFVRRSRRVSLHGIGEPLANPHLFETVRWCDASTDVVFVSNALLFTDARIDRVLAHRVALIDFSLDAGTAETYRRIRHNDFAKAVGNIRRLIAERDRRGLVLPEVVINMCLMRANVADVPAFVRLAHDLRVTAAHLFHMNHGASYRFGWFDYAAQHCDQDPDTHDRFVEEGFALAEQLGVRLHLSGRRRLAVADSERKHWGTEVTGARFFCSKPWDSLLVQVNGDVFNCCWQARPLGNLERESLWQIWNGPLLRDLRARTAAGDPHPVCTESSSRCPFLGRE